MAFRGTFDYSLDAKNRLTVPAKFRDVLSGDVVIAKGIEHCIEIWRAEEYEQRMDTALAAANPLSKEARELRRFFSSNSLDTRLDNAGRVGLPQFLIDYAGLDKEVVVTGAGDCLEIWQREAWSEYNDDLAQRAPELAASLSNPGGGAQ